jgi:hypothetical protein
MTLEINNFRDVLREMFPKEKYSEFFERDKKYALPYLLINNANKSVEEYLESKKSGVLKKKIRAVFKSQNFEMDILKIAVVTKNYEFLEKYCEKYPHLIKRQDSAGYSAYHIAAIVIDEKAIKILRKYDKCRAFKLKNNLGGTYEDILKMRKLETPKNQLFYYKENGKMKKGDGRNFKKMTGAFLRTKEPYVAKKVAIDIWRKALSMEEVNSSSFNVKKAYEKYRKKRPLLYIKKTEKGYSLFAGEHIKALSEDGECKMIIECLAKLLTAEKSIEMNKTFTDQINDATKIENENEQILKMQEIFNKFGYLQNDIPANGRDFKGLFSMVNDGPSNTTMWQITNEKGLPSRICLLPLRDIEKDEEILYNYGIQYSFEYLPYKISDSKLEEIKKFILEIKEKHPQEKCFLARELKRISESSSNLLEEKYVKAGILYIISRPVVVLEVLDYLEIDDILKCFSLMRSLNESWNKILPNLMKFYVYYTCFKKLKESKNEELLNHFREKAKELSISQLLEYAEKNNFIKSIKMEKLIYSNGFGIKIET